MGLIPMRNQFYSPLAIIGQSESATWHSLVGPPVAQSPLPMSTFYHITSSHFHINVWMLTVPSTCHLMPHHRTDDTWHFFIGPHGCLKMPKMSDTWQPLMLPHHPADINMMSSCHCMTCTNRPRGSLWACHVAPML
jgi:hypothetical protein